MNPFHPGQKSPTTPTPHEEPVFYTPGYSLLKLGVLFVGLAIFLFGASEIAGPLWLLVDGQQTTGEATRIIKTKPGLPEQFYTDDLHARGAVEARDRSYTFWNEFRFSTIDGADHLVRLPIGRQLEPLFSLLDSDGLPTTVALYYDRRNPDDFCIPIVVSTWFGPGLFTLGGLVCALIGAVLYHHSRQEIEVP